MLLEFPPLRIVADADTDEESEECSTDYGSTDESDDESTDEYSSSDTEESESSDEDESLIPPLFLYMWEIKDFPNDRQ